MKTTRNHPTGGAALPPWSLRTTAGSASTRRGPTTPAPARVAEPEWRRFEPLTSSPELAARIQRWVDALPTEGMQNWVGRLCKANDSLPLHSTEIYLWALRPDGQVLSIDHESFARRAELENDPVTAYAALAQGARAYPELGVLLAHNPAGARQCEVCGGLGWREAQPPAQGTDSCQRCSGMGWRAP